MHRPPPHASIHEYTIREVTRVASNRKQPERKISAGSDPVTGEAHGGVARLERLGVPYIVLHDHDPARHKAHRSNIPYRLHSRQEERVHREDGPTGDLSERLGCHVFSPDFLDYLSEGEKSDARKAREWWHDAVIVAALDAHILTERPAFSLDELNIALNYKRGYNDHLGGHTPYWIDRAVARVARYVSRHLAPVTSMQPRQQHQQAAV
jgi:hypothetical protein